MTTLEELNGYKKELEKSKILVKAYEAKLFLVELWDTATYTNSIMNEYFNTEDHTDKKLFDSLYINYFVRENTLISYIQRMTKHFKDVDDSQDWPKWKKEAYKQAKIYQSFYNSDLNNGNKYEY